MIRPILLTVLWTGAASAQGVVPDPAPPMPPAEPGLDCIDPVGDEIVKCAEVAFADADAERDLAYRLAITQARVLDDRLSDVEGAPDVSAADALRQSQGAFLAHRDAACAAEALLGVANGEGDLALLACLTRLTQRRVEDLARFGAIE